jgi:uncharacterized protein (TIGR02147 family)
MKRIEYYSDYRLFLKDYYLERKKAFKYFSYRYFCKKAGISSPSYLKEVFDGKRTLTLSSINTIIRGLELTEHDGRFFTALVLFNQAKASSEKQEYLEQLRNFRRRLDEKAVPLDLYAYYSKWYYSVIRELACCIDWKENYAILAKSVKPSISIREAKEAFEFLLGTGFLKRGDDGRLMQSDPALSTGPEVVSPAIRELNRKMGELGVSAISEFPPSERDISSTTLGLTTEGFQKAKQEIQEFKRRIKIIANEDKGSNKVYNLNVHLFQVGGLKGPGED